MAVAGLLAVAVVFSACSSGGRPETGEQSQENKDRIRLVHNRQENKVEVLVEGELFTAYMYPEKLEKPVLYPVKAPDGTIITRGFPFDPRPGERVDHPHQVGLWFNYGDVNGLDFWNNSYAVPEDKKEHFGTIRHQRVLDMKGGDDRASLKVLMHWLATGGDVLLEERTEYIFMANEHTRTIDRITRLTARDKKVSFRDNKEGLIALRMDRAFEMPSDEPLVFTDSEGNPTTVKVKDNTGVNGHYRSSRGVEGLDVWGTRAEWVSLSAEKDGVPISVAIIDHPENPGFPTYWHARGYGLFSANNLGQKIFSEGRDVLDFALEAGSSVTFRHRIYIRSGRFVTGEEMDARFREFSKTAGN